MTGKMRKCDNFFQGWIIVNQYDEEIELRQRLQVEEEGLQVYEGKAIKEDGGVCQSCANEAFKVFKDI